MRRCIFIIGGVLGTLVTAATIPPKDVGLELVVWLGTLAFAALCAIFGAWLLEPPSDKTQEWDDFVDAWPNTDFRGRWR